MAESLGTNADLSTAYEKWRKGKGVVISTQVRDTNAVMRAALKTAYNVTTTDFTTLLTRFLKTRAAP